MSFTVAYRRPFHPRSDTGKILIRTDRKVPIRKLEYTLSNNTVRQ